MMLTTSVMKKRRVFVTLSIGVSCQQQIDQTMALKTKLFL